MKNSTKFMRLFAVGAMTVVGSLGMNAEITDPGVAVVNPEIPANYTFKVDNTAVAKVSEGEGDAIEAQEFTYPYTAYYVIDFQKEEKALDVKTYIVWTGDKMLKSFENIYSADNTSTSTIMDVNGNTIWYTNTVDAKGKYFEMNTAASKVGEDVSRHTFDPASDFSSSFRIYTGTFDSPTVTYTYQAPVEDTTGYILGGTSVIEDRYEVSLYYKVEEKNNKIYFYTFENWKDGIVVPGYASRRIEHPGIFVTHGDRVGESNIYEYVYTPGSYDAGQKLEFYFAASYENQGIVKFPGDKDGAVQYFEYTYTKTVELLEGNITVGEFARTGSTSGTLPYTINITKGAADIANIDHLVVWASRVDDENMNVTNVSEFTFEDNKFNGVLTLDVLPENANTAIWPKAKAVMKDGKEVDFGQTYTVVNTEEATTGEDPKDPDQPQDPTIEGNVTSGTITGVFESNEEGNKKYPYSMDYKVTYNEDKTLTIWYKMNWTAGVPVGIVAGETNVDNILYANAMGAAPDNTYEHGTRTATTVKGEEKTTFETGQEVYIETYLPAAYSGVVKVKIPYVVPGGNDTPTGIEDIEAENGAEAVYFNLQGMQVANPVAGEIYIVVKGNKSYKMIAR